MDEDEDNDDDDSVDEYFDQTCFDDTIGCHYIRLCKTMMMIQRMMMMVKSI